MSKLQSHPSPSEMPLGSAQVVTSGLDQYGEVMASGLWVGDGLGSEDMQILTQINLGLHRSVYKLSMWLSEKIQMRRPIEGGCREEANRKSELLLWFREKKILQKNKMGYILNLYHGSDF